MSKKNITTTERRSESKYVLIKPHISEKATDLSNEGFYVFIVKKGANKREVKDEVEKKYKVKVEKVMMINVHPKKKRIGRTEGETKGYKKAIVKLKKGQNIDLALV